MLKDNPFGVLDQLELGKISCSEILDLAIDKFVAFLNFIYTRETNGFKNCYV